MGKSKYVPWGSSYKVAYKPGTEAFQVSNTNTVRPTDTDNTVPFGQWELIS